MHLHQFLFLLLQPLKACSAPVYAMHLHQFLFLLLQPSKVDSVPVFAVYLHQFLFAELVAFAAVLTDLCSSCLELDMEFGTIQSSDGIAYRPFGLIEEDCWKITVLPGSYVILKFDSLILRNRDCFDSYIKIVEQGVTGSEKETKFCGAGSTPEEPFVSFQTVKIIAHRRRPNDLSFTLKYYIKSSACNSENAFYCSNTNCIPGYKVCNGIKDCDNGLDEKSCKVGISSVEGVDASLRVAYNWLEAHVTLRSGWKNNLHRSIVALHLSGRTSFNGNNTLPKHQLLVKQLELETALALLRNSTEPVSANQLSMLINALLVTCHNPRYFYGFNLIQLLTDSMKNSEQPIQPIAYLALCNAKKSLSKEEISQLLLLLEADTEYPFAHEIQAVAVIALSCVIKNGQREFLNTTDFEIFNDSVQELKKLQNEDGSFGNIYTSALIVQALLSKGEETSKDWNLKGAITYLMKELKSDDFLSIYMILPILNRKSLADIADVNCTGHLQLSEGNPIDRISYKLGPKMRVQYSLYLKQNKDIIHTIYLTVSKNISAYEVMEVAAAADPKYKFQWKPMSGKKYVFEINGYINDPEVGLFWLTYLTGPRFNGTLIHYKESLDDIEIQEDDHLIMWYHPAHL
ncbi:uncharacterized protein LOC129221064 [Uloborus diversus]|uniref:uncharacterized protein LOC129221064 n=1 Tax=Uloborus diversus TaxID=327109 RepID=UPI0024096173|nr:uncharacterized protein LOC129221064 [Uloborus diversus]